MDAEGGSGRLSGPNSVRELTPDVVKLKYNACDRTRARNGVSGFDSR